MTALPTLRFLLDQLDAGLDLDDGLRVTVERLHLSDDEFEALQASYHAFRG